MEYLAACPLCNGKTFIPFLECKDHTVSHETFSLEQCAGCDLVFTNPRPREEDLAKYYQSEAYISHSDKSRNLIDKVYKISRNFTLKWKQKIISDYSGNNPSSILDYGCGTGAFLLECRKHSLQIAGVEPSASARAKANEITGNAVVADLKELSGRFHAITLWHVLEHVIDLQGTISNLKAHLDENGTMFIAVPNLQSLDAKRYQAMWAAYDVPRHLWHFSKTTMRRLLESHNLKIINVVPMKLDAFYVCLLSEKYKKGTHTIAGMTKAVLHGSQSNRSARKTGEYSSLIYIVRK